MHTRHSHTMKKVMAMCRKELKDAMPSGSCEVVVVVARSHMMASVAPIGHKRKDRDVPSAQAKQLVFDYFENEFFMKVVVNPFFCSFQV